MKRTQRTRPRLRMIWRQRELNFEPGSEHLYSNMGFTLLAEIVERVGGRPFPEWMQENVFAPLGMNRTHMHDDHEHVVSGRAYSHRGPRGGGPGRAGGPGGGGEPVWRNAALSYANAGATSLFTTAGDLARWLRNFETETVGGPGFTAQMRQHGVLNDGDRIPYAFRGRRLIGDRVGKSVPRGVSMADHIPSPGSITGVLNAARAGAPDALDELFSPGAGLTVRDPRPRDKLRSDSGAPVAVSAGAIPRAP